MKAYSTLLTGTFILFFITSCGNGELDKRSELERLRKQHDGLALKIDKLEKELRAETDSSSLNVQLVAVAPVATTLFEHYIEVQGKLDGDESVSVSPLIASRVTKLNVQVGDYVKKGHILAILDDKATGQSLDVLKNNLELTTDMYERQKRLYEQKIGSEVSYLQIKNQKETLEKSIASIEDMIYVKSPIDGTVEEVSAKIGEMVSPQYPPFRVVSFRKLKVTAEIAESYSSKVKTGDKVSIFFPDLDTEVAATITSVSRFINPVNRTFLVEAAIQSTNANLKANMVAVLKITDYKNPQAIALPVSLIQNDLKGPFVMVVKENGEMKAKKIPVKTGVIYNGIAEVTEGLKTGDKLITWGALDIEDGEAIKY